MTNVVPKGELVVRNRTCEDQKDSLCVERLTIMERIPTPNVMFFAEEMNIETEVTPLLQCMWTNEDLLPDNSEVRVLKLSQDVVHNEDQKRTLTLSLAEDIDERHCSEKPPVEEFEQLLDDKSL
jgi:hypothetical protein